MEGREQGRARQSRGSRSGLDFFWSELPPCEHMVQLYSDESQFLQLLAGFVAGGLAAGESVILLATPEHLSALASHLAQRDIDLARAQLRDHYIVVEAEEAMAQFMVNGMPDEVKMDAFVCQLLDRASTGGRRVRAFGELVAVMWARGQHDATVRLEQIWDRLCLRHQLSLFCAYPSDGFGREHVEAVRTICAAHSRVLPA